MKAVLIGIIGLCVLVGNPHWSEAQTQAQQQNRSMPAEFGYGVAAPLLSVIYFPIKASVGVVGAVLGGVSGMLTGGSERAAEGIWRPTAGGTYFITPDVLTGEERFRPLDGGPRRTSSSGFGQLSTTP